MGCEEKFSKTNGGLLNCAVLINVILSVVQFIAGFVSGSLSLAADALHNLSDAGSIVIALIVRKSGQKAPNLAMTYGYK